VQTDVSPKGIVVKSVSSMPLPPGSVFWGNILDYDSLTDSFVSFKKAHKISAKSASINLPMQFCDMKRFDLPKGYFKKESLDWEMHQHFIGDVDKYRFRYIVSGEGQVGNTNVVVSALKEPVDERAGLVLAFDMDIIAAEPDILAVYNGLTLAFGDLPAKTALLLDLSFPYCSFALIRNNVFLPGGSIPVPDEFASETILNAIPEFVEKLKNQFNKQYDLDGINMNGPKPELIAICGVYADDIVSFEISKSLEIPVLKKNPTGSPFIKFKQKKIPISWQSFIKALGLSIRF